MSRVETRGLGCASVRAHCAEAREMSVFGLPPTPDNFHLGCSYHLHLSHHFLSTWVAVMLAKKMERVMADLGQLLPSWHGGHVTLRKRTANRIKAKRQLSRVMREDSNSEVTYYARH